MKRAHLYREEEGREWLLKNADVIIKGMMDQRMWIAPVGRSKLLGFMVCRRVENNCDNGSSRVDHLSADPPPRGRRGAYVIWKKPFMEKYHMFATFEQALEQGGIASGAIETISSAPERNVIDLVNEAIESREGPWGRNDLDLCAGQHEETKLWHGLLYRNKPTPSGCPRFLLQVSDNRGWSDEATAIEELKKSLAPQLDPNYKKSDD